MFIAHFQKKNLLLLNSREPSKKNVAQIIKSLVRSLKSSTQRYFVYISLVLILHSYISLIRKLLIHFRVYFNFQNFSRTNYEHLVRVLMLIICALRKLHYFEAIVHIITCNRYTFSKSMKNKKK